MENNLDRNALSCYRSLSQHLLKCCVASTVILKLMCRCMNILQELRNVSVSDITYMAYIIECNFVLFAQTYPKVKYVKIKRERLVQS